MRKSTLLLALVFLLAAAGGLMYAIRAQESQTVTVQVNGETIVLKPGENISPEDYALAQDSAILAQSEWVQEGGFWFLIAKGVTTLVEVEQIILPEGHPEFPLDTAWVYVQGEILPIEVPVPLRIPESWRSKYAVRVDGNTVYYDYSVNSELKEKLFSITALTETQWQAIQGEPHGEALFTFSGIVWVYNPALENLYSGSQAEEFQQMVGEAYEVADSLATFFAPAIPAEAARQTLMTYFAALSGGRYAEAARFYGGDYDVLTGYNPEIDPNSHVALFEAACTVNGFACGLQIGRVVQEVRLSDLEFRFAVEFQTPDGSPFELGPCCGADPSTSRPETQFAYTVQWQDERFRVMELPIYVS